MFNILAISAPQWADNAKVEQVLSFKSLVPFSLQNAMRQVAKEASCGNGMWDGSNYVHWKNRNDSTMLLNYWNQEKILFEKRFKEVNPTILYIGAMSLSFLGAIEVAKLARILKGENLYIVLGGKHCNETLYKNKKGEIKDLQNSPLQLMLHQKIPPVFDLVCSGDGEFLTMKIAEIVYHLLSRKLPFSEIGRYKSELESAPGNWVAGAINNKNVVYYKGANTPVDYESLPYAVSYFDVSRGFEIFGTSYTAHAFSDVSRGCFFDCFFCSEKLSVNQGKVHRTLLPAYRLAQQFKIINDEYKKGTVSIFVEDSVFLSGNLSLIDTFFREVAMQNICLPFGMQLTADIFLHPEYYKLWEKLKIIGLEYIAFGVETISEEIAATFGKNTDKKKSWLGKTEQIVATCAKLGIKCGMFFMCALGETQQQRVAQLYLAIKWMHQYGIPIDVGLNIATIHPLQDENNTLDYTEWGTPQGSPYLEYLVELFGEASLKYAYQPLSLPSIEELKELRDIYRELKSLTYQMTKKKWR